MTVLSCSDGTNAIRRMELRRNEMQLVNTTECIDIRPLVYTLNDINENDEGPYQCVAQLRNGTYTRVNAGNLHTHGM